MTEDRIHGVIRGRNLRRRRDALLVEEKGYVVFELLAGVEPEVGHEIAGLQWQGGGQTVRNESEGRSLRVFVEYLGATKALAHQASCRGQTTIVVAARIALHHYSCRSEQPDVILDPTSAPLALPVESSRWRT
jgi:hypothetical protein